MTLVINGIEIKPSNIDEKVKRRMMFLLRKSDRRDRTLCVYVDMLRSAVSRRNWDETEKISAKLSEIVGVKNG